ncbi:hypothetical protein LTR62_002729 [Meristemomyces frigidus]|uniref:BHLH domain-containing protein n=1 Tax=Meristemomyces frigidus TaxID=1508187 RepID=A0AAN7TFH7_9PEZI|nr:hypothetical protein LTR62_002729 [Meristemomyces frigidus]
MDSNANDMASWPPSLTMPPFGQPPYNNRQHGEDWEDWLRWDPAADADATSPEDGTFASASSKNDSPLQDPALPYMFGQSVGGETLAPPLIAGEDMMEFAGAGGLEGQFDFGAQDGLAAFDFDAAAAGLQTVQVHAPKLNTVWPLQTNALQLASVSLSALTNAGPPQHPMASLPSLNAPSLQFSPISPAQNKGGISGNSVASSPSQPAPKKKGGRKRKAEVVEPEEMEEVGDWQEGDEPPVKKTSHNVIEKRYRNNLNDKIVELRNAVPALRAMGRANKGEGNEDLEGLTPAHKLNKATVMHKATEYIRHLEKRNKTMQDEMDALKAQFAAVEAAIGKTRDRQASASHSPPAATASAARTRNASSASQSSVSQADYLGVPANLYSQQNAGQQQYTQSQPQPSYAQPPGAPVEALNQPQRRNGQGRNGAIGKVMMGAMAGLMMMEGFSEQDGGDTRQMFAAPGELFRRGLSTSTSSPASFGRQAALPLLKAFCIFGAFLYLIAPLFTLPARHRKAKARMTALRLPQVPSLASPVEVRRKAWLTALQTVYVPKHFLLEVAAVTAKMISLSLRRLISTETWVSITGTSKEEEAARMKAWDIAIDAQLAGGDAEVSYHRLLLTLMASGTLPDSPTRLMQKAVHFRVFFWEVANAGYGNILGFKAFTEKVGRIYWISARKLQKELLHARSQGRPCYGEEEVDLLPDHLAALVEMECEDVLSDETIQRAWNLAFHASSSSNNTIRDAPRDGVIEDHAIRSPLDAVAAWYANDVIDDTLIDAVSERPSSLDMEYYLALAVSVAPPASATQARALAAKAVLSSRHRGANVVAALEALPLATSSDGNGSGMNLVPSAPATPDVRVALTIAKLLALLAPASTAQANESAYDALSTFSTPARSFTLLTAIAAYRLLTSNLDHVPSHAAEGLVEVAGNLRLWIGSRGCGLEREDKGRVIEGCLGAVKVYGGWSGERDSGYGGSSAGGSPVRETTVIG